MRSISIATWVVAALVAGCEVSPDAPSPRQVVVAEGLLHPWDIAFLSAEEALVTEKDGQLRRVNLVSGEHEAIRGFPGDLDNLRRDDPRDNSGLFGVELDPDYPDNGWIYVAYSAGDAVGTALTVIRARLGADSTLVDVEEIFKALPLSTDRFHYGGGLVFDDERRLYVTVGERVFDEGDQAALPVAQDSTHALGKVFRVNADGSIPRDNPDFGPSAVPGIYALGIRASQGITRDPRSGEIWFSEHGPTQGDEINRLAAGANYGWPVRTTGTYRNGDYRPPEIEADFSDPVHHWEDTVAPTGLAFHTGKTFPEWDGHLFVAGLSGGNLWRIELKNGEPQVVEKMFEARPMRFRKIEQGPDGSLYLLTDEANGRVIRLERG